MLVMSFGRPLVTIDRGFLHDVVIQSSGVLYKPEEPNSLVAALERARAMSWDEFYIQTHVSQYRYEGAARIFVLSLLTTA